MAAVNSVQSGLRLPLTGLAPPRVLMCSASMGAEGSVTLQLREAVQAPDATAPLDAALTIGYPDPEILADMLGTLGNLQAAATNTSNSGSNSKNNNEASTSNTSNVNAMSVKKARPKTASPTRHGPQQCQVCSKVFGNASALAKHKLTHSDERKYVCGMCSKAFKRQDHLNGHMLTHRNKKPYECKAEGCGKSYCDARSLRRHTENHHSSLAMTPTTPHSSLSSSTGPPTGLSLSPATASGDASSPHGATCIPFSSASDISSKPSSPSSPAGVGNEGLTRQQLDLISQIMQQTKQANAGLTASAGQRQTPRPRTWNMQTQLQQTQSKLSPNPDNATNSISSSSPPVGPNVPKLEQKPVECNLCHRKFKNIPALNGHMRLHGGYFKKDAETKKCDKKETPGPPLQTASVGVRALIEEKIISKRSKDLKGAFVVPAPPLAARRLSDTETFLSPKLPPSTTSAALTLPSLCQTTTTIATALQIATSIAPTVAGKPQKTTDAVLTSSQTQDSKDATLIELLKRGTKVAVKRTNSDPGTAAQFAADGGGGGGGGVTKSNPATPTTTPPLALSIGTSDSTPLALTISQDNPGASDVFTLAYSTDSSSGFFHDNEVYSVNDTAMLLQAVDSIQLLHEGTSNAEHIDEMNALGDYALSENNSLGGGNFASSRQLQAVLNSPLPESLAEFSTLHSKDYILYGNSPSAVTQSSSSPLPSPLAYPTPPASHEAVAQASPFLDDSHHFADVSPFFGDSDKKPTALELTDNERIIQLKNELFSDSKSMLDEKPGDIFKEDPDGDRLRDLAFLDEPDSFLEDAQNPSSPLSAAFFSATMSSAEEVKEALQEVLPNENLNEDTATEADDIDLYYLPMCNLQSQMMPNSDDPLLSSSPKDFVSRPHKFEFGVFCPPSAKRAKGNSGEENVQPTATPLTVQTEQPLPPKDSEVFLSPSSISSTSTSTPSPKILPMTSLMTRKRHHTEHYAKVYERFRSRLRNTTSSHFTPSPMLNPSRNASGIYFCLIKDGLHEEEDCLLGGNEDFNSLLETPRINVGINYQAKIPDVIVKEENLEMDEKTGEDEDTLLWDPKISPEDRQLRRYVELSKSSAVPLGSHSEEMALKTLLDTHGEIHTAILELLQAPATAIHKRWTPQEIKLFLKGLETFRKDFYRISKEIPHKSTGDCIQLYYFWKKLCVDYKLTHLQQNNQRRISHELNNNAPLVFGTDSHNTPNAQSHSSHTDIRPHICEMPDCSASFQQGEESECTYEIASAAGFRFDHGLSLHM
ncbi:uncharacterized protein LOC129799871 isoform X3 [Phlebotomus papatasi]|uniref:uncharacterized protein LOC129799871 isoform X3 n=1 Tax=Phlebotomus papatasi TaxID=29031 RepID=UPI0024832F2D|nr:uncharacterized protein LOC129799871 isoform X3 [Phlebotomus papatasi]